MIVELEPLMPDAEYRRQVLRSCLKRGKFTFASGVSANNKLDLEKLAGIPALRRETIQRVGALVVGYGADSVVGVPEGANWLAAGIAVQFDLSLVKLKVVYQEGQKAMDYADRFIDYEATLTQVEQLVVVEDALNNFTNTRMALSVPGVRERVAGVAAVYDRGTEAERYPLAFEHHAVIVEPIPAQLPKRSELWRFAK